ncbi:MAG: universal stress protein [Specibacter sp.]
MSAQQELTVGVDGSPSSRAAVDWAALRASQLGLGLHLVHVIPDYLVWPGHKQYADVELILRGLLDSEASRVRTIAPSAAVRTSMGHGEPAPVLAELSAEAAMVVVGTDRAANVHGEMFGVVNLQIATIAQCSVAVVPARWDAGSAGVVVGYDGSAAAELATEVAAGEAENAGQELTVLYAPKAPHGWLRDSNVGAALGADAEPGQRQLLEDGVAKVRARHQELTVHARFEKGTDPAQALIDASTGACLLVLGSPGRASVQHVIMGSVTQHVLMKLPCPVVLARTA